MRLPIRLSPTREGRFNSLSDNSTRGFSFTLNTDISVTQLGFFDLNGDGLDDPHQVGIWTHSGTLLGQVTVAKAHRFR